MAAGLGFKIFNTGDVLTAADVNGYLMQGVLVFASAAARDAAITSPQEGQIAYLKDTNGTTYYTGSAWASLVPTSFGKVLQVVSATYSTQVTSTSTTYADTGLSATITPSATNSKVMILTTQTLSVDRSSGGQYSKLKLLRGATDILTIGGGTYQQMFGMEVYATGTTYLEIDGIVPVNYLDSPSTTSATTYKTQFACAQQPGGPTVTVTGQRNSATSTMILLEIGA